MSFDARLSVIGKYKSYDFETITVTDEAIGLTAAKLITTPRPKRVSIAVETAQMRYRKDGTAPTSSVGVIINVMDTFYIEGVVEMANFRAIRTTVTSGKLQVHYER